MKPELGNLDDIDWDGSGFKSKLTPTTDQRVRELIEWAEEQSPETFED
jgi:hypothetical protein